MIDERKYVDVPDCQYMGYPIALHGAPADVVVKFHEWYWEYVEKACGGMASFGRVGQTLVVGPDGNLAWEYAPPAPPRETTWDDLMPGAFQS